MFNQLDTWLSTVPPLVVYLMVALVIGLESMGVPLPGEVTLISAALLAAHHTVDPLWVAAAASAGAIGGDSLGYLIGKRGGRPLLERAGRRFPKHLGPDKVGAAERLFSRFGMWAVFFGRFVALLRILAGPLAGVLRMPYRRFLVANATGGITWAFATTYLIFYVGQAAEKWLKGSAKIGLVVAILFGIATTLWLKRRARRHFAQHQAEASGEASGAGAKDRAEASGEDQAGAGAEAAGIPPASAHRDPV